jgi:hypothetical protein
MMSAQNFPVSNSFLYLWVALWDQRCYFLLNESEVNPKSPGKNSSSQQENYEAGPELIWQVLIHQENREANQIARETNSDDHKMRAAKIKFVYWILTYPSYNSSHSRPKANPFWKTTTKSAKTQRYFSEFGMIWKWFGDDVEIVPHQSKFRNACEKENSINLLKVRHLYELSAFWMTHFLWLEIAPLSSSWPESCQALKNDAAQIRKTHENSVNGQVDDSPAKIALQLGYAVAKCAKSNKRSSQRRPCFHVAKPQRLLNKRNNIFILPGQYGVHTLW